MEMFEVLRWRRTELGLSQSALAARAGVDARQIRRYEAGEQQPVLSVAAAIAEALGISLDELAGLPVPRAAVEEVCEVVITAPDAGWLSDFTRELVEDRLCASGHLAPIRALYRWHGEVFDKTEQRVALYTRASLVAQIIERVLREHPYDVPAVAALPLTEGSAAYLQWVRDETRDP